MPYAKVGDLNLFYEVNGSGFPLVLIRGFGSNADHWAWQVSDFSKHYQTVVFDNRGIARSDKPKADYTMRTLAEDAMGVMDALGLKKAHILGLSMGGMIAQRLALDFPERVAGLVLACTHCGGAHAVAASQEVSQAFAEYVMTGSLEAATKATQALFAAETLKNRPELVREYSEVSLRFPNDPAMLLLQYQAIQGFDAWGELPLIKAPTLVLAGDQDVLIPPKNSGILAERIPGARLEIIKGGGHQFVIEQDRTFNRIVMEFLGQVPID